jgi:hypothetical protein
MRVNPLLQMLASYGWYPGVLAWWGYLRSHSSFKYAHDNFNICQYIFQSRIRSLARRMSVTYIELPLYIG